MSSKHLERLRWVVFVGGFWVPVLAMQILAGEGLVPWWVALVAWPGLAALAGVTMEQIEDEAARRRYEERVEQRREAEAESDQDRPR